MSKELEVQTDMAIEDGDRTGQLFVYKDSNEVTKVCMVGFGVSQEEFGLMPDYLKEHFERPSDEENEVILEGGPTVFVLPDEDVMKIEESMKDASTT